MSPFSSFLLYFCSIFTSFTNIRGVFVMCCVAVLCGGSVPPPVLSYHSVMVLQFMSDSSIAHRGFIATLTYISHTGVSMILTVKFVKSKRNLKLPQKN